MNYLIIPLILIPLIELTLLLRLADWVGGGPTFLLILGTGMAGASLIRRQGMETLRLIQQDLQLGRMPADRIFSGLLILVGGVLLITPGILTDLAGLLLMIPGNRRWIISRFRGRLEMRFGQGGNGPSFFRYRQSHSSPPEVSSDGDGKTPQ